MEILGRARNRSRLYGTETTWNDVLLGKGKILPGVGKFLKKVGKVTSPITTAAAKAFLPASLVDAAAKLDPTKKGMISPKAVQAVQTLTNAAVLEKKTQLDKAIGPGALEKDALIKTLTNPKVLAIIGGGALVLFIMAKKRKRG